MGTKIKLLDGYEEWKIYPPYEIFYIECIISAAESAISSWEELNSIVSNPELLESNGLSTIDLSENIINQAGIISRYFFPTKYPKEFEKDKVQQLRGDKLRISYKIDENSMLEKRDFRNYIEHFDENLDEFLNKPIAGNFIPKTLYLKTSDIDFVTSVFKAYIVEEFKLISMNKEIQLIKWIEEIYRIYNLSIDFLENGGRLK